MNNNDEGSAREIAYIMMSAPHLLVLILRLQFKHLPRGSKEQFFAIIRNLLVALSKRQAVCEKLNIIFGFLRRLQLFTRDEIVKNSLNIVKMYPKDLELSFSKELFQLLSF